MKTFKESLEELGYEVDEKSKLPTILLTEEQFTDKEYLDEIRAKIRELPYSQSYGFRIGESNSGDAEEVSSTSSNDNVQENNSVSEQSSNEESNTETTEEDAGDETDEYVGEYEEESVDSGEQSEDDSNESDTSIEETSE